MRSKVFQNEAQFRYHLQVTCCPKNIYDAFLVLSHESRILKGNLYCVY